jgi:hypothetical protein
MTRSTTSLCPPRTGGSVCRHLKLGVSVPNAARASMAAERKLLCLFLPGIGCCSVSTALMMSTLARRHTSRAPPDPLKAMELTCKSGIRRAGEAP